MEENKIILKDYGWCQILKNSNQYFIRYDLGGAVIIMNENEISKKDAKKAMVNQNKANEIVIELRKKNGTW